MGLSSLTLGSATRMPESSAASRSRSALRSRSRFFAAGMSPSSSGQVERTLDLHVHGGHGGLDLTRLGCLQAPAELIEGPFERVLSDPLVDRTTNRRDHSVFEPGSSDLHDVRAGRGPAVPAPRASPAPGREGCRRTLESRRAAALGSWGRAARCGVCARARRAGAARFASRAQPGPRSRAGRTRCARPHLAGAPTRSQAARSAGACPSRGP